MISYSLPFLSSMRFLFFFFYLLHFVNHTRIPILVHPLLFFFPLLSLDSRSSSLFLSPALLRSFYSLFFSSIGFYFLSIGSSLFFFSSIGFFFFFFYQKLLTLSIFFTLSFSNSLFFYRLLPRVISASIFFSLFLISCCFWF